MEPKRIVREGYDLLGSRYAEWSSTSGSGARAWFLAEVLERLTAGADVLELGCGPGTAAAELAEDRSYTGVDLSAGQLAIARARFPDGRFLQGDLTDVAFSAASFDAVVAFYVFNHVPRGEIEPTFGRVYRWLRPGGRFMLSLGAADTDDEIQEDWLGVPMFFAGFDVATNERCSATPGSRSSCRRPEPRSRRVRGRRRSTG